MDLCGLATVLFCCDSPTTALSTHTSIPSPETAATQGRSKVLGDPCGSGERLLLLKLRQQQQQQRHHFFSLGKTLQAFFDGPTSAPPKPGSPVLWNNPAPCLLEPNLVNKSLAEGCLSVPGNLCFWPGNLKACKSLSPHPRQKGRKPTDSKETKMQIITPICFSAA